MEGSFFSDVIYEEIQVPELWKQIIDTPTFQRLRFIKQLGSGFYVYPGGIHTRFTHCIGTANLSRHYITSLQSNNPDVEITQDDISNVSIAGLCHDIGHGPFSHLFESLILPKLGILNWCHEQASVQLLEYIVDSSQIDIDQHNLRDIQAMMLGNRQGFKYEIVNNSLTTLDTDKMDYLQRDSWHLGFRNFHLDWRLIMQNTRIVGNSLHYDFSLKQNIVDTFNFRHSMFDNHYCNISSSAVDLMITDILINAEPVINIKQRMNRLQDYIQVTDSILDTVMYINNPQLEKSKEIINRLNNRDLYKLAGQAKLSLNTNLEKFTVENISTYNQSNINLQPDDIDITIHKISPGNSQISINYYNNDSIITEDVTFDKYYRLLLFVKDCSKLEIAQNAFALFLKQEAPQVKANTVQFIIYHYY